MCHHLVLHRPAVNKKSEPGSGCKGLFRRKQEAFNGNWVIGGDCIILLLERDQRYRNIPGIQQSYPVFQGVGLGCKIQESFVIDPVGDTQPVICQSIILNNFLYMKEFCASTFKKFFSGRHITEQVSDLDDSTLVAACFMDFQDFAVADFNTGTQWFIFGS